jgi:uncharacterized membrane protein YfcA
MAETILIGIVALSASLLTFFSGFGLGTILLPVFLIFFPAPQAIALTAIVHLLNNVFKMFLIGKHIHFKTFLLFGIPAIIFAWLGAKTLIAFSDLEPIFSWQLFGAERSVTLLKVIIGILMILFGFWDILPSLNKIKFSDNWLPVGGTLSGFFGGLSGHQGALRSAFLIKAGLSKEMYIATGTAIAMLIDIARIVVYRKGILSELDAAIWPRLIIIIIFAMAGAIAGKLLLKKITIQAIERIVGLLIIIMGIALLAGLV